MRIQKAIGFLALTALTASMPLFAQFGSMQSRPGASGKAAVTFLFPQQISVVAGKATGVDLQFKVGSGLHINSNKPHAEELIPTTFKLPDGVGVTLKSAKFPEGQDFTFAINPKEKLSVYTGEFTIHAEIVAQKGEHLVEGTLRYQACDNNACMPPHSIPG